MSYDQGLVDATSTNSNIIRELEKRINTLEETVKSLEQKLTSHIQFLLRDRI